MRWIGKQLLTSCMTLLCGVFLAGAARALSLGAELDFSDPVSSVDRDARINGVRLFARSRIPDALYRTFTKTNATFSDWPPGSDLVIRPKIAALRTRHFASGATISVVDGVRVSTAGRGYSPRLRSRRDPCPVVPEPGTLGLLGGGLFGLGLAGRRSRR